VLADFPQGAEVDLQEHRNDHQPDQHGDGDVDLGDFGCADRMEHARQQGAEHNSGGDT